MAPAKRRRFSNQYKLSLLRKIDELVAHGLSREQACKHLNIDSRQYRSWSTMKDQLKAHNPRALSTDPGRDSILKPYTEQILRFIFEQREQGVEVSIPMVSVFARTLCREFRDKTNAAQIKACSRFVKKHSLVYRMGTHISQRSPELMENEARDFMADTRLDLIGEDRHQDYIINMDQTPVYFTLHRGRTLESRGKRTINIRKSTDDTRRVTFAYTITASLKSLRPILVFKGKPNGRIVTSELPTFPQDMLYACQTNAWMDEVVMRMWVERVLAPHVATAPPWVVPILYLDSYRCHVMAEVVHAIQDLGVEVKIIPGGCTGLCQPVDVGANKPFKGRVRTHWQEWLVSEGLATAANDGKVQPPTRRLIADWCLAAYQSVPTQNIINAWRKTGPYTWFAATCAQRPIGWIDPIDFAEEEEHELAQL